MKPVVAPINKTKKGQVGTCEVCRELFTATRTGQYACSRDCGKAINKADGDRALAYQMLQRWKLKRAISPKKPNPAPMVAIRPIVGIMCCPGNCGRRIAPTSARCRCGWTERRVAA